MGIFQRLATVIKANINALIGRAEDPEKVLDQLLVEMRGQLAKTKQEVAAASADEKKLQAQVEKEKKAAEDWERRAMLAVQEGRDDLAKQALLRHNEHLQAAQQLHETWVRHKADVETLKVSLRELNDKIEDAKRKKNLLVARQRRVSSPTARKSGSRWATRCWSSVPPPTRSRTTRLTPCRPPVRRSPPA